MSKVLDGKVVAKALLEKTKDEVDQLISQNIQPKLAVLRVGNDEASDAYSKAAIKKANKVSIQGEEFTLPGNSTTQDVITKIEALNNDSNIHGIIVMQPLPEGISRAAVSESINADKDVDALNPVNFGRLAENDPGAMVASTPMAVIELLDYYGYELKGKNVCVVGSSPVVGKPLTIMLLNRGATVDNCHIYTTDTASHTKRADIVVSATGALQLIDDSYITEGSVVVDVGYGYKDGRAVGDVQYDLVEPIASAITPVPGGIGSITTAVLNRQVLKAAKRLNNID